MTLMERIKKIRDVFERFERAEASERIPIDPYTAELLAPRRQLTMREEPPASAVSLMEAQKSHAERREAVWAEALAAIPAGLRSTIARVQTEIAGTERDLAGVRERLAHHERTQVDDRATWVARHSTLLGSLHSLESLLAEQRETLRVFYLELQPYIAPVFAAQVERAETQLKTAEALYHARLAAARAEIGRERAAAHAAREVRSQAANDLPELERRLGMQVTHEPTAAEREAARDAERAAMRALVRGRGRAS